ncbi:hypothetical protein D9M68_908110 [compost metagenome]
MGVGVDAVLGQAGFDAVQGAAVDGKNRPPGAGFVHQRLDMSADSGNAGHFRQAGTIQANGKRIRQLRHVGAARA